MFLTSQGRSNCPTRTSWANVCFSRHSNVTGCHIIVSDMYQKLKSEDNYNILDFARFKE